MRKTAVQRVINVTSRTAPVVVYVLSDLHIGHAGCNEKAISEAVKAVQEENAYWIGLGDMVDAIGIRDPRAKLGLMAEWLKQESAVFRAQRERAVQLLRPIGERCIMYLKGNHEEAVEGAGVDLYYSVAEGIGVPADAVIGFSGYLQLRLSRNGGGVRTVVFYAHHGWGGGELIGGTALKLERLPARHIADIYLMGHVHRAVSLFDIADGVDKNGTVRNYHRCAMTGGTFLRTTVENDTTYAERTGKPLSPTACARIELYNDDRRTVRAWHIYY